MTLRFEDLYPAIERNDVPAVVRLLHGAAEKERAAVRSKVMAEAKKNWDFQGNRAAAAIAALGVASGAKQATEVLRSVSLGDWIQQAVEVLTERKPSWIDDLPKTLLATESWGNPWRMIRALVRTGLIAKPDAPEYTTLMPQSLARDLVWRRHADPIGKSIEQQLLEDPGLLEDEVFRLFRVEGAATSLYSADSAVTGKWVKQDVHPEASWSATIVRLARAGHIDVDRLLDESIAVFMRDMKPTHFGWYVDFHEQLAPTLEEMAARAAQYERLLASDTSLGVGVGQDVIEKLLRANRLDLGGFVAGSRPALNRAEKGIVSRQIRLLGLVAKQRPDLARQIADVLEPALTHERPEIQEAARALAAKLPAQQSQSEPQRPVPEASNGRQATVIAEAIRRAQGSKLTAQIQACVGALESGVPASGVAIPIGPGAVLPPPISDPEEVVVAFTKLVEDAGDPILIERAIAGAVRTARVPLDQRKRMAGPLAKRAAEQMNVWPSGLTSGQVRPIVASVAYTWSTGQRHAMDHSGLPESESRFMWDNSSVDKALNPVTPTGLLAARCIEAVELIASRASVELLSEPTHERGAIDPAVFGERARKNYGGLLGPRPPRFDIESAALRVRRADVGAHLDTLPKQVKGAYVRLLAELPDAFGLRVVSGRADNYYGTKTGQLVLAQSTKTGREFISLQTLTNLEQPIATYRRLAGEGEYVTGYGASIKTWPLIAPWLPELAFAHLLRPLSRALQPGKHDYGPAAMACLMNRDTPLDAIGHLVLAMGSIGAEEDTRTSAADAFAAASRDGRLQPELMAGAWIELQRCEVLQPKRLESTLRRLVSDPASSLRIAQSLQAAVGPLIESGARDLHVLLRLAASAGAANGVFAGDPRVGALAERKGGSELVAAARALVAAPTRTHGTPAAANMDILEGLLQRT